MHDVISKSLEVLHEGGVILYPTETVWGLGCDPTNEAAIKKIFAIKQRSDAQSLLLLTDDAGRIPSYVDYVPEAAWQLLEAAVDPLTIVYPGAKNLAPGVIAPDGSVGIRVTSDPFCKKLIQRFKKPLVSTSANLHKLPAPATFNDVSDEIINAVDYAVAWNQDAPATGNKPSSIIKLGINGEIQIIRM